MLLAVPSRGTDVGTWDSPVNNDLNALDGYLGGFQIISASNAPITLTAPSGTPTPSGGPTQAQNSILSFTGTLTANVQVTLPLPGTYQIENLTTGNFVLSFRAVGSGQVIGLDQGMSERIYNDGTNVRFAALGALGRTEMWAGLSALPAWITACTKRPYLLCDGSVYNFTDYPYLGARLGGNFGGNGVTTFGVPDLRGRVPLPYDGTGTRITSSQCGIAGQTLGAAADNQSVVLSTAQMPVHSHGITEPNGGLGHQHVYSAIQQTAGSIVSGGTGSPINTLVGNTNFSTTGIGINNTGNGQSHTNVQPAQVTGIAVIRAA